MTFKTALIVAALAVSASAVCPALADDRDTIVASCRVMLQLSPSGCECIADKAGSEFSDKEFAYFMAIITSDPQTATIQGNMTVNEITHVGTRMGQMRNECAAG